MITLKKVFPLLSLKSFLTDSYPLYVAFLGLQQKAPKMYDYLMS